MIRLSLVCVREWRPCTMLSPTGNQCLTITLLLLYLKKMISKSRRSKWTNILIGAGLFLIIVLATFAALTYLGTSFESNKKARLIRRHNVPSYTHSKSSIQRIEKKLGDAELSLERRAVLRAMLWCVKFIDSDTNFHYIFSDYVTMLYEITLNRECPFVKEIATRLARNAFKRGGGRLEAIFPYSASGAWDFISIIPFLYIFDADIPTYLSFYNNSLPSNDSHPCAETFSAAALSLDYDNLTDYLVDYSFLNFAHHVVPHNDFSLPPDEFPRYLKLSEHIPLVHGPNSVKFSEQNYYVTHVVYAMSHYGSRTREMGAFENKILLYLKRNYNAVRYEDTDIDLLAEFTHCLKILGQDHSPMVTNAVEFLISRQRPDGSWGSREDKAGDPYDAFHPTWTAMVAIHYSSRL